MIAASLQSGSNGNCIYVECGGTRLLFDAGISGLQAQRRLALIGRDIRQVDALIVSHDHSDHVRCAGIYQRKFGVPVYVTGKTLEAALRSKDLGPLQDVRHFKAGDVLSFADLAVETISTPHDGADGVAFVVVGRGKRLGILTDLGHAFTGLSKIVHRLDGLFLESNYDPEMLDLGPYPEMLKRRIKGPGGHVSNFESAELLLESSPRRLQWLCLAHLSEQNNTPKVAMATHKRIHGGRLDMQAASRYAPTGPFQL